MTDIPQLAIDFLEKEIKLHFFVFINISFILYMYIYICNCFDLQKIPSCNILKIIFSSNTLFGCWADYGTFTLKINDKITFYKQIENSHFVVRH